MGFSLSGYVIEKPRTGSSNGSFTSSPDNYASDPVAYSATFGSNEESPGEVEYLTVVLVDGDLPLSELGWTKNEGGIQRFDYDGSGGRFRTLPGKARKSLGLVGLDSNTNRMSAVPIPKYSTPFRVSFGPVGSGTTLNVSLVQDDLNFTVPTSGTIEISLSTGHLNWAPSDLPLNQGQEVFFQQQAFFTLRESKGNLGVLGTEALLLNPIPGDQQVPLIRIGSGLHLIPVQVPSEASFSNPVPGTFQWAISTGMLRFNSLDSVTYNGFSVFYDGVLIESMRRFVPQSIGTVSSPTTIRSCLLPKG